MNSRLDRGVFLTGEHPVLGHENRLKPLGSRLAHECTFFLLAGPACNLRAEQLGYTVEITGLAQRGSKKSCQT